MHNGMTLTWIQGQGPCDLDLEGQGPCDLDLDLYRDLKVAKSTKFTVYLLCQNSLNLKTHGRFLHYRTVSKI